MLIVKKEPGGVYYAKDIPNELEAMQREVGGYIELFPVDKSCGIICDEEGRLKGRPYNTRLAGVEFVGPIMIVGMKGGDFCDVPAIVAEILEARK